MSKYPHIEGKDMYAAVMGACRWIRESGYFNKATKYYADKYGLDVEDVRAEVRKRQGAGQRGNKTGAAGPMKWFVVVKTVTCEAYGDTSVAGPARVVKAKKKETAGCNYNRENMANDYGGSFAPIYSDYVLFEGDRKKDADSYLKSLTQEKVEEVIGALPRRYY